MLGYVSSLSLPSVSSLGSQSLWRSRKGHGEENQVLVAEGSGLNLTSCHSFPLANVFQVPAAGQAVPGMVATAIMEFR